MGIDITQFHQVFFEESFEGLDIMEDGLLNLNLAAPDSEAINSIFRAAHSIKGGSGSFGFDQVTGFTHILETLLDQVREGTRQINESDRSLLLMSVDTLRDMLTEQRDENSINMGPVKTVQDSLNQLLNSEMDTAETDVQSIEPEQKQESVETWKIEFIPEFDLFKTGNDPARMFREIQFLGELKTVVKTDRLPDFSDFDPEECYLSWSLEVSGDVSKDDLDEVFEWVIDDCKLEITPVKTQTALAQGQEVNPVKSVEAKTTESVSTKSEPNKPVATKAKAGGAAEGSIRVGIDKVDSLINMIGELVITQAMLSELGEGDTGQDHLARLRDGLEQLERNTRELQEGVMQIRMLPISFTFNRFPRLVHDVSQKLNKKVELVIHGEQTELDKTVLEKIGDPLVHLVRNSLDHGLETPDLRLSKGKSETGQLSLDAYHQGGSIIIKIADDGAGLNAEKIYQKALERGIITEEQQLSEAEINELIFKPGFSTADEVSDLSGRGVGMDVVRRNIKDLGGTVEVESKKDIGSTFTIRLPLTLAILDGQQVRIGDEVFIIPLISVMESLPVEQQRIHALAGKGELYQLRDDYLPIIRLYQTLNLTPEFHDLDEGILVIVEVEGQSVALFVDELLGQQQVVIKSLETNYTSVLGFSGATILGNGRVALIIDVADLIQLHHQTVSPSSQKVEARA